MLMDFRRYPWADNEDRVMCLPAVYVAELKARATADVSEVLSTGDCLFAWRTKLLCKVLVLKSKTPIGLIQPYSLRGLIDTLPADEAYTSNATAFAYLRLSVKEIETTSLGQLALQLRRTVKEYRTKVQAESYLQLVKRHGILAMGPHDQIMMGWYVSNFLSRSRFRLRTSISAVERAYGPRG
jgi:hypothetical protein